MTSPDLQWTLTVTSALLITALIGLAVLGWRHARMKQKLASIQSELGTRCEASGATSTFPPDLGPSPDQFTSETHRMIQDIVSSLPIVFFCLLRKPRGELRFLSITGKTERFMLWSRQEILANFHGVFPNVIEEDISIPALALRQSVASLCAMQVDVRVSIDQAGTRGWVRMGTGIPVRKADGSLTWNGYWTDVSSLHIEAEHLLAARMAAESNVLAKARFLATMSHEIRTPLATIAGALELLRDSSLTALQREELALAENSAQVLMDILTDILDFSSLEAGAARVDAVPFDPRLLLEKVLAVFSRQADAKGLSLDLLVASDVPLELIGDPVRIKQIVLNLVGNALKFTVDGGITVTLTAEGLKRDRAQVLQLSIADTGVGIALDTQRRIFEPFEQADPSTARRYGGSGLGLSVCKRLAELMGGTIAVRSAPGQGSVFEVRLTLDVARTSLPETAPHGKRIAVRLSRALDAEAVAAYARALGMELVSASDDRPAELLVHDSAEEGVPPPVHIRLIRARDPESATGLHLHASPVRWTEFKSACAGVEAFGRRAAATEAAPDLACSGSVLIVDDHVPYQLILRRQLSKLGLDVDVAGDGEEALCAVERKRYSLLITDCHMPGMDGFEMARRIRAREAEALRPDEQPLPIVALSADLTPELRDRCTEAGMSDRLAKPLTGAALHECVKRWVFVSDCRPTPEALFESSNGRNSR